MKITVIEGKVVGEVETIQDLEVIMSCGSPVKEKRTYTKKTDKKLPQKSFSYEGLTGEVGTDKRGRVDWSKHENAIIEIIEANPDMKLNKLAELVRQKLDLGGEYDTAVRSKIGRIKRGEFGGRKYSVGYASWNQEDDDTIMEYLKNNPDNTLDQNFQYLAENTLTNRTKIAIYNRYLNLKKKIAEKENEDVMIKINNVEV